MREDKPCGVHVLCHISSTVAPLMCWNVFQCTGSGNLLEVAPLLPYIFSAHRMVEAGSYISGDVSMYSVVSPDLCFDELYAIGQEGSRP